MIRPHQFVWIGGLGFLLGVALGTHLNLPLWSILVAGTLLVLTLVIHPHPSRTIVAAFLLTALLGWWRCQGITIPPSNIAGLVGHNANITGRVVSDPIISGNQQNLHLRVDAIDDEVASVKILLTAWHLPNFHYADQLAGRVKFLAPSADANSYANYLRKNSIYLTAEQAGDFTIQSTSSDHPLAQLYRLKHWIDDLIHRFLPEPHSALLSGLLLGIRSDLSDDFRTALRNSGTSHIVALSGFNVTIIISFLLLLLRRLPRRLTWILSGLAILGFVIMTGAASSVVRAAIMGWLLLLAGIWGRRRSAINAVLLAAATMVALHPLILVYDVSFQLSVAATLGLLYGTPILTLKVRHVPSLITEAAATTLGATVFTLPLIALYFGGVSWVTLMANLLVVPLVPYVMLVGCVGTALFACWSALQWLSIIVWPFSALLLSIINWFGHLPAAFIPIPALPVWVPVGYYLLLAIIIYVKQPHRLSPALVV